VPPEAEEPIGGLVADDESRTVPLEAEEPIGELVAMTR
jgi:hypothetical protein